MGATCSSGRVSVDELPPVHVPIPVPSSLEDWARTGAAPLLRAHEFLGARLEAQLARRRGAGAGGAGATPVRARLTILAADGSVLGDVFETPATLAAVREALRGGGGGAARARNAMRDAGFVRVARFCEANRAALLEGLASGALQPAFAAPLAPRDVATLAPELDAARLARLVALGAEVARLGGPRRAAAVGEDALELFLRPLRDSVGEGVFFHLFFRAALPGPWPREREAELSVPQFAQALDRFCAFSPEQLLRFAFFCLARVGARPGDGEVPLLAVSSMPFFFPEMRAAARDRGHASRPLWDELRVRGEALRGLRGPQHERLRLWKAHAARLAAERDAAVEAGDVGDPSEASNEPADEDGSAGGGGGGGEDDWGAPDAERANAGAGAGAGADADADAEGGGSARRRRGAAPSAPPAGSFATCSGADDLLTVGEFLELAARSPLAVFDLVWLQAQLRRATFGEAFWLRRHRETQRALEAGAALGARARARAGGAGGGNGGSGGGGAEALFFGYLESRCCDPPVPAHELEELPRTARVPPVFVPAAVRYACARQGDSLTRTPDEAPAPGEARRRAAGAAVAAEAKAEALASGARERARAAAADAEPAAVADDASASAPAPAPARARRASALAREAAPAAAAPAEASAARARRASAVAREAAFDATLQRARAGAGARTRRRSSVAPEPAGPAAAPAPAPAEVDEPSAAWAAAARHAEAPARQRRASAAAREDLAAAFAEPAQGPGAGAAEGAEGSEGAAAARRRARRRASVAAREEEAEAAAAPAEAPAEAWALPPLARSRPPSAAPPAPAEAEVVTEGEARRRRARRRSSAAAGPPDAYDVGARASAVDAAAEAAQAAYAAALAAEPPSLALAASRRASGAAAPAQEEDARLSTRERRRRKSSAAAEQLAARAASAGDHWARAH